MPISQPGLPGGGAAHGNVAAGGDQRPRDAVLLQDSACAASAA